MLNSDRVLYGVELCLFVTEIDMPRIGLEHALFGLNFKDIIKPCRNTSILDVMKPYLIFVNGRLGIQQAVMQSGHPNVPIMFY